jgi:superfamily II DNA helicase RecQ
MSWPINYQHIVEGKHRVILTGPETAASDSFHAKILRSPFVRTNVINFIIDEGHSVTEWGTDDFRPEYAQLANVIGHLPHGVPITVASATIPPLVKQDLITKISAVTNVQDGCHFKS